MLIGVQASLRQNLPWCLDKNWSLKPVYRLITRNFKLSINVKDLGHVDKLMEDHAHNVFFW